jgi:type I restriction enzyme S subunit
VTVLPSGWVRASLKDVAEITLGQSPPGGSYNTEGSGTPFFQGSAEFGHETATVRKWTGDPKKHARAGDLLLSVRAPVGPTNVAPIDCAIGRGLAGLRARAGIEQRYLLWAMRATSGRLADQATGSTFEAVSGQQVRDHVIPVAPVAEQQRIVEALESHHSRLDAGTADLNSAAERARQLMHALATRTGSGSAPAEQQGATSSVTTDVSALARRSPLTPLIRAPAGWRVATLGELAVRIEYGSSVKAGPRAAADDVAIIRMGNIQNGEIDWNKLKYLPGSHPDTSRLRLHDGDLLFNRTNSAELVGKCAVYRNPSTPATFASYLIRCRFGSDVVPEWVALVLNSSLGRAFMMRVASQQVGQANVNGTKLAALPIPLPPVPLQQSLLEEMATWTASAQRLTTDVMQGLTRAQQLRRSLLGAAFSGQLVPQDPNDEPAELLLKRIQAERATEAPRTRRTRNAKATP